MLQREILLDLFQVGEPSYIPPEVLIGAEPENPFILGNETKIGSDDREGAIFRQLGKKLRRNHVNSGKVETGAADPQAKMFINDERPGCRPILVSQSG